MTHDFSKEALELHREHGGKLEVRSKVPLNSREDLSRAYTPGVGQVCIEIGNDPNKAYEYTLKKNTVAVVSDGSAILGLGNLGAKAAIPVMEGKAILFKEFAGVDAFPICLDTQETEEIIKAVKQIAPVFGAINLEDISAPRCFEIERRLRAELDIPVMHDDQHGTATVVLAGLINALTVRGITKEVAKVVFNGAGAAGTAVAKILISYGFKNIIVADSKGAMYVGRPDLNDEKKELAGMTNPGKVGGSLAEIMNGADIFVGVSKAGLLTAEMVKSMNERPIIFALANPVPEIMPDVAKAAGAYIVATGRSDFPNQVNNVLGFPGLFRGALDHKIKQFDESVFLRAAAALAAAVKEPTVDMILPSPLDKSVVPLVARAVQS
jgi:malate dehydrogenase (oxaloacetate-decarboxylating)